MVYDIINGRYHLLPLWFYAHKTNVNFKTVFNKTKLTKFFKQTYLAAEKMSDREIFQMIAYLFFIVVIW